MSASVERKETGGIATDGGPWVTLNKACGLLKEGRDIVQRRALLGQIRTVGVAHVVLFNQRDVERIASEKEAERSAAAAPAV